MARTKQVARLTNAPPSRSKQGPIVPRKHPAMGPRKPAAVIIAPALAPVLAPVVKRTSARIQAAADAAAIATAPANRVVKPSRKVKDTPPRYTCTTCDRNLAASTFPKYLATDSCKHLINTCKPCLKSWITAQMEYTTYDKIKCPECPALMLNSDMKIHATKEVYQRFDDLERRGISDKVPGWRWCLNFKCRAGKVHEPSINPASEAEAGEKLLEAEVAEGRITRLVKSLGGRKKTAVMKGEEAVVVDGTTICTCDECGSKACVPCDKPYHEGETCAQYAKRVTERTEAEEKASVAFIKDECKQCPKCSKNIEKDGGCDSVICECSRCICLCTRHW